MRLHSSSNNTQTHSEEADNTVLSPLASAPRPTGLSNGHTDDFPTPPSKPRQGELVWRESITTTVPRPRFTEWEWESHRAAILVHYLQTDHSLQETIEFMKQQHGFDAT
jgi:hypothetical protein